MRNREVAVAQVYALIEEIEKTPVLAKGILRSKEGRLVSRRLWVLIARKLNAIPGGAQKSAMNWKKYFTDYKSRVLHRAERESKGGTMMTPMERRLADVLFKNKQRAGNSRTNPLEDSDNEDSRNNPSPSNSFDWPEEREESVSYRELSSVLETETRRRVSEQLSEIPPRRRITEEPRQHTVEIETHHQITPEISMDDSHTYTAPAEPNPENIQVRVTRALGSQAESIDRMATAIERMSGALGLVINRFLNNNNAQAQHNAQYL